MKMENAIVAPFDGQIEEVCVRLNETVQEGQLLITIKKIDNVQMETETGEIPE